MILGEVLFSLCVLCCCCCYGMLFTKQEPLLVSRFWVLLFLFVYHSASFLFFSSVLSLSLSGYGYMFASLMCFDLCLGLFVFWIAERLTPYIFILGSDGSIHGNHKDLFFTIFVVFFKCIKACSNSDNGWWGVALF